MEPLRAEGGVAWGETAGGLQIGAAAETPVAPAGESSPALPDRLRVYLRNNGQTPVRVVEPSGVRSAPGVAAPPLVVVLTGEATAPAAATPSVTIVRPSPARVVTLVPSETVSFTIDVTAADVRLAGAGPVLAAARYQNDDPVVLVAAPTQEQAHGVWVGGIRSGDVKLTLNR